MFARYIGSEVTAFGFEINESRGTLEFPAKEVREVLTNVK